MTHRTTAFAFGILATFAFAAACGGGQSEAIQPAMPAASASVPPAASVAPAASTSPVPPVAVAPGPGDWAKWSHDQKLAYMKSTVMPKMGAAFEGFDPKNFASPRCTVCHATGAKDGTFKMPDPGIAKLPANPADFKALAAKEPKIFEFMSKTVVPQTAALLGVQPFDMATKTGFGCYNCHTKG